MGLFKKKMSTEEKILEGQKQAQAEAEAAAEGKKDDEVKTGNPKVDIEFTKIKGKLEAMDEVRKANSERFQRISEQIGELRGMIVDTNKTISSIEVTSTKAVDLVESVQPEKLMIEVRKQDGKTEALRANIESNEAMMKDLMSELKKMRKQMNFYKGIEQVTKLNDEVKREIMDIKKVEANIERHADKVESIFVEVEKKFSEFDKFNDVVKDMKKEFQKMQQDFEKVKVKVDEKADKKEFVNLVNKFNDFEKHTGNILKLLDDRSRKLKEDLEARFEQLRQQLEGKTGKKLQVKPKEQLDKEKAEAKAAAKAEKEKKKSGEEEEAPKDDNLGAGDDKPMGGQKKEG